MVVLTSIPSKARKNRKLFFGEYTKAMLIEQRFIADKYQDDYTTCYICSRDPIDMTIVPDNLIIKPVSYLPTIHVLFEITEENEE